MNLIHPSLRCCQIQNTVCKLWPSVPSDEETPAVVDRFVPLRRTVTHWLTGFLTRSHGEKGSSWPGNHTVSPGGQTRGHPTSITHTLQQNAQVQRSAPPEQFNHPHSFKTSTNFFFIQRWMKKTRATSRSLHSDGLKEWTFAVSRLFFLKDQSPTKPPW